MAATAWQGHPRSGSPRWTRGQGTGPAGSPGSSGTGSPPRTGTGLAQVRVTPTDEGRDRVDTPRDEAEARVRQGRPFSQSCQGHPRTREQGHPEGQGQGYPRSGSPRGTRDGPVTGEGSGQGRTLGSPQGVPRPPSETAERTVGQEGRGWSGGSRRHLHLVRQGLTWRRDSPALPP